MANGVTTAPAAQAIEPPPRPDSRPGLLEAVRAQTDELARALQQNALHQVLFNAPPGDWAAGERGLAGLPGRESEFRASIDRALRYAERLRCSRVHVMAGKLSDLSRLINSLPVNSRDFH